MKNRLAVALRMAAQSLHRSQSYLGQYFRRMRTRLGTPPVITAAAHKLARILYHLITARQQYQEATFAEMNEVDHKRQLLRLAKKAATFGTNWHPLKVFLRRMPESQNLERDCVWVCSPTDYNDPHDSSISIVSETLAITMLQAGIQHLLVEGLGADLDADLLQSLVTAENPALALQKALLGQDQVPPEFWPPFIELFRAAGSRMERNNAAVPSAHSTKCRSSSARSVLPRTQ